MHRVAQWLAYAIQSFLLAWLAVQCHRVVLAPQSAEPVVTAWSGFEWKYMLWTFAVFLMAGLVTMIAVMMSGTLFGNLWDGPGQQPTGWWQAVELMAALPAAYVLGRSILVLPAVALGQEATLGSAWRLSRGNGWRLAVVVGLLPYLLNTADNWLYTSNIAPWMSSFFTPLSVLLVIVEVVAMSLCYRELS